MFRMGIVMLMPRLIALRIQKERIMKLYENRLPRLVRAFQKAMLQKAKTEDSKGE